MIKILTFKTQFLLQNGATTVTPHFVFWIQIKKSPTPAGITQNALAGYAVKPGRK